MTGKEKERYGETLKNSIFIALVIVVLLNFSRHAYALDLVQAYEMAQHHDPKFQSALAEYESNQAIAKQAKTSYFPEASYNRTEVQTQTTPVETISITQPLINVSRYASAKQAMPRLHFAQETLRTRQQELMTRLLFAVTNLVRAKESAALNKAKINNLEHQNARAKKLYELGHGTITDLRDIQVKYDQARANQITNDVQIRVAERAFSTLIGTVPQADDFILPTFHASIPLDVLPNLKTAQHTSYPNLIAARHMESIGKLEAQRIRGNLLPTVSGTYSRSSYSNTTNITKAFTVSVPLNMGSYYASSAAAANAIKAREERRFIEEQASHELERTYALVEAGQEALKIKRDAITSAELSVVANNKSYDAGVRSNIDVVNSIQILFEVKNDYVIAVTQQAENLLQLLLLAGNEPDQVAKIVQKFLFN